MFCEKQKHVKTEITLLPKYSMYIYGLYYVLLPTVIANGSINGFPSPVHAYYFTNQDIYAQKYRVSNQNSFTVQTVRIQRLDVDVTLQSNTY